MPGWLRAFVRFVLGIWFRRVEVVGAAGAPSRGPLIVIANHENGLLDPMLIAGYLPIGPRFLGKSTLWKIPVLWPFLKLARVVPVQRRKDEAEGGGDMSKNQEMFAVAAKVLEEGGVIALFPEGESHNQPGILPLKTGAARICLSGPETTRILAVGIAFHDKHRFRGRALVMVGEVLDPTPFRAQMAVDPKAASHALTDAMSDALKKVTINVPTWEDRTLLERAVEISRADDETLESRVRHLRAFTEAWQALSKSRPEEIAALRADVARYDRELHALRMTDEEVRAKYRPISIVNWCLRFVRLFLLNLPFGALGVILHAIPYQVPRLVANLKAEEDDQPASYKIMTGVVIYPVWWALLVATAWLLFGGDLAWLTALVAPASAYYALEWLESGMTLGDQARGWLMRGRRRELVEDLRAQREQIGKQIARLEAVWRLSGNSTQGVTA